MEKFKESSFSLLFLMVALFSSSMFGMEVRSPMVQPKKSEKVHCLFGVYNLDNDPIDIDSARYSDSLGRLLREYERQRGDSEELQQAFDSYFDAIEAVQSRDLLKELLRETFLVDRSKKTFDEKDFIIRLERAVKDEYKGNENISRILNELKL